MAAHQDRRPGSADSSDEEPADRVRPVPDEDGPHDVPDENVIEKTLPSPSVRRDGDRKPD